MLATLLTDFGTADYFVGAMKGALLAVCARASIVDITHEIPAHDIEAGAFTLLAAFDAFPPRTVHVAVVDPGVGSARRPLLVVGREHLFVGPDNGIFSYIRERDDAARVFHLTNENYFRPEVSATFHGRDLFAPVAGALLEGVAPALLGEEINDHVRLPPLSPVCDPDGTLRARVIHVDRFGNCITNITRADLPDEAIRRGARLSVGGQEISGFRRCFADSESATATPLQPFALRGSAGFLEIAVNLDSAARLLNIKRGDEVKVMSDE